MGYEQAAADEQDDTAQRPTSREEEQATNRRTGWYCTEANVQFVWLELLVPALEDSVCHSLYSQSAGLAALGIYVHFPHYHCENGTSIIPYQTAMNVELAFVCSELLSRLIFVA